MTTIDLTYPVETGMLTYDAPWHPGVSIRQIGRIDVEGRETRNISFGSHTGTHMDAPLHFIAGADSISEIPLEKLHGKVTIIDAKAAVVDHQLDVDWVRQFPVTRRIIFRFGWGTNWGTKHFYEGYPYFTKEVAEYLVEQGVEVIGIDTPSPDPVAQSQDEDSPVHKILLGNNIVLLEYLANLDAVQDLSGWNLIAFPLNVVGADGCPVRACIYR